MKTYNVEFEITYESYNGYDHKTSFKYDNIQARTVNSAENKAKKLLKQRAGGYLQRGDITNTSIFEL